MLNPPPAAPAAPRCCSGVVRTAYTICHVQQQVTLRVAIARTKACARFGAAMQSAAAQIAGLSARCDIRTLCALGAGCALILLRRQGFLVGGVARP